MPQQRDPKLRLDRLRCLGLAAAALPWALFLPIPGRLALAEMGSAENLLVVPGTWHADARAVHRQRQPLPDAPMVAPMFFHQQVQTVPQQRQPGRRPGDQCLEQPLVGRDGGSSQHVQRPVLGFREGSRQGGLARPYPDDRQQDQFDNLPCGIAMQLHLGENLLLDSPGDCGPHSLAIAGVFALPGRPRILSLCHNARLLKRPRRSRWLGWESGIFFDSLDFTNPAFCC